MYDRTIDRMSDGRLNTDTLSGLPDEEFVAELTAIPGIGPWTAQGALLVALGAGLLYPCRPVPARLARGVR